MKTTKGPPAGADDLRRRAEKQLKAKAPEADFPRTGDETQRLLHELQIHQIELEMQNVELRRARDELESANVELDAFNYSVSHDLRKPLTVINATSQLISELCGDKLDLQCRRYVQDVYEATLRMNRLINTLLDFSRVTRAAMRRVKVGLSGMAEEIALELNVAEPARRVAFRIAKGVAVDGDEALLRVVLDNLIGNAWKFTGNREGTVIEFGVAAVEGTHACFVRDNGPGFDMAHAGTLFTPFQRLPGTEVEGNGIGLATVEKIVRRHGGRVWAKSRPGEGATFYFTLE